MLHLQDVIRSRGGFFIEEMLVWKTLVTAILLSHQNIVNQNMRKTYVFAIYCTSGRNVVDVEFVQERRIKNE